MAKSSTLFQSYLLLGKPEDTRRHTQKLADSAGIRLYQSSPDVFIISPQKGTNSHISIDQIRELKKHIWQKPFANKFKFLVIEEADKLTLEAQNSLLKILEEPPAHAIIVLEAKNKASILPTVRSRVVEQQIIQKETDGNIQSSLLKEDDTTKLLEEVADIEDPVTWLDRQVLALHNLLKKNAGATKPSISLTKITDIIEECIRTKKMIEANVNPKFALINLIFSLKLKT